MNKIKTALISVSDKKNLKPLLNTLKKNKVKIISSGGTYKEIKKLKFKCLEVSEFSNSPEILEGRVKTLHPKIHAGILNKRSKKSHQNEMRVNEFENIDLVIVNFYPFENTLKNTNVVGNLGVVANGTSLTITTANGSNISIPVATTSAWGAMSDDLVSAIVANTAKETNEETVDGTVDAKGKLQLATNEEAVEGASTSKVLTPRAAVGLVTAKKVHDLTAPSAAFAMNSQKITGVANPTANQDAATKAYVDAQAGQTVVLGSASGLINRTAAQFASDGTDQVYIGSNNYGWNDARDWATQTVSTSSPTLDQNDQYSGIICPVAVSQVTLRSQVRMNSQNGTMIAKVYKMNRASGVSTSNLALTEICSASVSTMNGRFTTIDIVGTTSVAAGQLIIVGFGKTGGGAGQKPRFNFTITGTTA